MKGRCVSDGGCRWRSTAAVLLAVALTGETAAQSIDAIAASEVAPATEGTDLDNPQPLNLERFEVRRLTAADLPPGSPLTGYGFPRMSAAFGRDWRTGRNEYRAIVEHESAAFGLPPAFVDAIMAVESRYNPGVVGMDGEVGLMQVMLPTARMLGFSGGAAELAAPEVNVHYGVKYLAGAWRLAGQDICTAAMKYRAGHGETRFSYLSVEYCQRVRQHLSANGVVVTGSVPQPTFGRTPGAGTGPRARSLSAPATVNFAALNARLRGMTGRGAASGSP
nr:transglycosylase SLT domain-containing protein [Bradyrhizobium sp. WSM3983]